MNNYPVPSIFKSSPVLNQIAETFADDSEVPRQLEQIALIAEYGKRCLESALADPNYEPKPQIPTWIQSEDGWDFLLKQEGDTLLIAADGSNWALVDVMRLMTLSPEEREEEMFANFQVKEWNFERPELTPERYELYRKARMVGWFDEEAPEGLIDQLRADYKLLPEQNRKRPDEIDWDDDEAAREYVFALLNAH